MLTFDEPTHTYRWNGVVVPGVTSILAPLSDYSSVPKDTLERASTFGRLVHECTHYMDTGAHLSDVSPVLVPYLDAWNQFSHDYEVVWDRLEAPAYSEAFGFAGTPDRVGMVRDQPTVVDIKTTAMWMPSFGPQLAAYGHLVAPDKPVGLHAGMAVGLRPRVGAGLHARMAVRLKADGTYEVKTYHSPQDWSAFMSCLTIRRFCDAHQFTPSWSK
jgi:hypothetical protein